MKTLSSLWIMIFLTCFLTSCTSDSGSTYSSENNFDEYVGLPYRIEQVVTRYCTTCGGSGQVMTAYGMANCPSCVAYGLPPTYKEIVLVSDFSDNGGDSPTFRGKEPKKDKIQVRVKNVECKGCGGSLCSCETYIGFKTPGNDKYTGACQNMVAGHKCGHSPSAHGL